jgi:predicted nuclease with TOPRIM domain
MAQPHKSQRFIQAAKTERNRLSQKRSRLFKKREDLQARVDQLDEELEAVDQEIVLLDSLDLNKQGKPELSIAGADQEELRLISGGAIRALAVPLLLREQRNAPIHYRDWLALIEREGLKVAGKRPDAVFLNQVARSPLVRATTKAGYYELDLEVPDELRRRLSEQRADLSSLMSETPTTAEDFEEHRERQREANKVIARIERELAEATSALETFESSDAPAARAA